MTLWTHTLVKNEDRYLWYAVRSVIDHVDKVLLWDTGSTDNTVKIAEELKRRYPSKIEFREVGEVNPDQFTIIRQKMLNETKSDWVIIVDGDEVWWNDKIKEVRNIVDSRGKELDSIVSKYYNIVGDIYHFQDESAGRYNIDNKTGNLTIRAMNRNIKGLKFLKPHGQQGIYDGKGFSIQERDPKKRFWQDGYSYLHFSNMQRSSKRANDLIVPKRDFKLKHEIGHRFGRDFCYPESFFVGRPEIVENVWRKADAFYLLRSFAETPLKIIKRKYFASKRSGY